jgi:uncharacterized protein
VSDHLDSRAERLAAALDDFIRSSPDVEAAAVVSFDGLPMASALPDALEEDRVGAMSAALLSLGEQAALGLGRGQLNQVFVEGEHGFVFLMSARDQAVLAAIAARTAKIGFMLFEMRRAADRVGRALESPVVPAAPVATEAPPVAPPAPTADEALLAEEGLGAEEELLAEALLDGHGQADPGFEQHGAGEPVPSSPFELVRDHASAHDGPMFGDHRPSDEDHMFGDHADLPPASSDAWTV